MLSDLFYDNICYKTVVQFFIVGIGIDYRGERGYMILGAKIYQFYVLMKQTLNLFLLKKKHECFTLPQ
jgi:hypothetical protein